ncbi:NAD(P)H-dependent oxidoreductase [Candidatus Peregrinibacteria bacterium CG10_big_fil_rev_8_21_14_0_10_36_19]|nr:MAG: NAD(P)H-dependent oxidoreductase [Candidatus Peregrinibacteria bacterium CG10_big_fil_rev_8_21_14_0_10_36_19]
MFLDKLDWRFATKHFDSAKKVSEEDMHKILESIHMAPSSFGLQPYHIYVVSDAAKKSELRAAGFNQPQFEDASHILVFCANSNVKGRVNQMIETMGGVSEEFAAMLHGFSEGLNGENAKGWAARQAYIALGFALAACAELGIDSCPMEGFSNGDFDTILGLDSNLSSMAVLAVGYRKDGPAHPKFRFSNEDLFTEL